MLNTPFEFIRCPKEIFKALLDSKESGTAIGVKSAMLGKGMFVTAVDDILIGDGYDYTRVVFRGYDFTGHVLETNVVGLTDIEGVCCFTTKFGNPILKALGKVLGN